LGSKPTRGFRNDHINLLCRRFPISKDETQADRKIHIKAMERSLVARIKLSGNIDGWVLLDSGEDKKPAVYAIKSVQYRNTRVLGMRRRSRRRRKLLRVYGGD
jgi:hypothetical protein